MRVLTSVSVLTVLWSCLLATAAVGVRVTGHVSNRYAMVGAQGRNSGAAPAPSPASPRINVLEVDAWRHSLRDGSLLPVAKVPFAPKDLISSDHFSPSYYRQQVERLDQSYTRQRDVLMYFGGLPQPNSRHGLNFNAWSVEELSRLRERGVRPFIGLETTDQSAITWMAERLRQAGYGPRHRIYVRILAEPSGHAYGSEDGSKAGPRNTAAAYAAYRKRFTKTSVHLRQLNVRCGLRFRTVFAGITASDFERYYPPPDSYDDLGYDLYLTPENQASVFRQLDVLGKRFPGKALVIPELGVATAGPGASPRWAKDALGDLLMRLARHPGGVGGVTVFSVNVARRMPNKRWSWAWTPMMFDLLKEWEAHPRRWRKDGFHRYDPLTYPVGRDVLFVNRSDLRIVYRRLAASEGPGTVWFHEASLTRGARGWKSRTRLVSLPDA